MMYSVINFAISKSVFTSAQQGDPLDQMTTW